MKKVQSRQWIKRFPVKETQTNSEGVIFCSLFSLATLLERNQISWPKRTASGVNSEEKKGLKSTKWHILCQRQTPWLSPSSLEEIKRHLTYVKSCVLMCWVKQDVCIPHVSATLLGGFEGAEGRVDDSGPLLLWVLVCPAVSGQGWQVEQEVRRRQVDFSELLLQIWKISLKNTTKAKDCYSEGANTLIFILTAPSAGLTCYCLW